MAAFSERDVYFFPKVGGLPKTLKSADIKQQKQLSKYYQAFRTTSQFI